MEERELIPVKKLVEDHYLPRGLEPAMEIVEPTGGSGIVDFSA